MQSSLRDIILHKLAEQPLSGYSLSKEIEQSTGQRPSFGSIYPILERLAKEGFLTVKSQGRRKIYTITAKGKSQAGELKKKRTEIITDMINRCRMFCELTGVDAEPMVQLFERMKKGEDPMQPVARNAIALRNLLFRMSQDGSVQKHKDEINKILSEAKRKLEKLA